MKNHTWYEVRIGGASTPRSTLEEAKKEIEVMKLGYPEKKHMTRENHKYWKRVSKNAKIYVVKQVEKEII